MTADRVAYRAQLRLTLKAEAEVRRLREIMELAVTALLPVLPLRGSWESGYEVESVTSQVRALPEEWAEAAYATAELHAAIKDHVNQAFKIEDMMGGLPPVPDPVSQAPERTVRESIRLWRCPRCASVMDAPEPARAVFYCNGFAMGPDTTGDQAGHHVRCEMEKIVVEVVA